MATEIIIKAVPGGFIAANGTEADKIDQFRGKEVMATIKQPRNFITDAEGGVVAIPKSISFASMDDSEFERLYSDALGFICQTWCLDQNQINQIVDFM